MSYMYTVVIRTTILWLLYLHAPCITFSASRLHYTHCENSGYRLDLGHNARGMEVRVNPSLPVFYLLLPSFAISGL